ARSRVELRRLAEARARLLKDQACDAGDRSQASTAIDLLHQGKAKTGVSFRLRGLDPGPNSREPFQTRIFTQVKGDLKAVSPKKKLHDPLGDRAAFICHIPCRLDSV